jgi:hypothetical protein
MYGELRSHLKAFDLDRAQVAAARQRGAETPPVEALTRELPPSRLGLTTGSPRTEPVSRHRVFDTSPGMAPNLAPSGAHGTDSMVAVLSCRSNDPELL